jgi:DnaJ-class molecular chaperone
MNDYYSILGVERTANADEIKMAYRRLASKHHPDRGGDKNQFQQIEEAYRTLGDTAQRAAYDNPGPQSQFGNFAGGFGFNFNDIFGQMFSGNPGFATQFNTGARAYSVRMSLWITLMDAVTGGRRPVSVSTPQGSTVIEIDIPPGVNDGDAVRYPNLAPGNGDLVVQFRVHPHAQWTRNGLDLVCEHSVSVWQLILGGEISVLAITGDTLTTSIPPRTQPRSVLRLRGKGIRNQVGQTGDLLIKLMAHLPDHIDPEIIQAIQRHQK